MFQVVKDKSSDEEVIILCPVEGCTDRSGNRSINVKTLYTNCWHCQGRQVKQPHHVKSLFRLVGIEFEIDHLLEPAEVMELLRGKEKPALTPVQEVELPSGFELLTENRSSCYWKFCRNMAERKHLNIEDLENAYAGFTRDGPWEPFCIFPVIESNRIVYYQGRTYSDEGFDKTKKFPSKKEIRYGMTYWVHGLDDLVDTKIEMVVMVESILNRLSLKKRLTELGIHHIAPVCVFTHYISRSQVAKIMRYKHVKEWCILFDSDSTGMAEKSAMSLSALVPTTFAAMPPGTNEDGTVRGTNDANDDVDTALEAIAERSKPSENKSTPLVTDRPNPW